MPSVRSCSFVGLLLLSSCREEPPVERHYPMRTPMEAAPAPTVTQTPDQAEAETEAPAIKRERPKPDPAIEAILDTISSSGRRFIDQADGEGSRPTEYT